MADVVKRGGRPWWMTPLGREPLGDLFRDRLWPEWPRAWGEEYSPDFDLYEKDGKYHLEADLPGFCKDDITITLEKGVLTVSGQKSAEKEEKGAHYYLKERTYGSFTRSLRLPADVDADKVEAKLDNGNLQMTLPIKGGPEKKKITVG